MYPTSIKRIMPEYSEMEVIENGVPGNQINAELVANELCDHYDDHDEPFANTSRPNSPLGEGDLLPAEANGDDAPETHHHDSLSRKQQELADITMEMENNDAHIPIYVGEEWPRPLSEIARPADNNAELFSLDTA